MSKERGVPVPIETLDESSRVRELMRKNVESGYKLAAVFGWRTNTSLVFPIPLETVDKSGNVYNFLIMGHEGNFILEVRDDELKQHLSQTVRGRMGKPRIPLIEKGYDVEPTADAILFEYDHLFSFRMKLGGITITENRSVRVADGQKTIYKNSKVTIPKNQIDQEILALNIGKNVK